MKTILDIVIRTLAVVVVSRAVVMFLDRGMGASANADIGGGAIAIGAVWLVVLAWSWYDGRRLPLETAAVRWVGVTVLFLVYVLVLNTVRDGWDVSLLFVAPVLAVLSVIPALLGVPLGGSRRPPHRSGT